MVILDVPAPSWQPLGGRPREAPRQLAGDLQIIR